MFYGCDVRLVTMSALKRLAPLAPRLTTSNFSRQQQRGFAASVGHGDAKVNCWEQPTNISNWKEEHIVFAVLGCWGVGIYSAIKIFGGGKKESTPAASPEQLDKH